MRLEGRIASAWMGFCDCMFLQPVEVTSFRLDGTPYFECVGENCRPVGVNASIQVMQALGRVVLPTMATLPAIMTEMESKTKRKYSVQLEARTQRLPDWWRCISQFCAQPGGCPHPVETNFIMKFNVNPAMALSPWTDVGAAAREIPKKGAGVFYDVTRYFTVINFDDYEPLKLWTTFWTNPTLFGILMAKITLIPVAGLIYQVGLTVTGVPVFLINPAIESAQRQGLDPDKVVWEVCGKGILKFGSVLINFFGSGVGSLVEQAAKDQIESGEIDKFQSEETKAIILFLAENGAALTSAVTKAGSSKTVAVAIFQVLRSGFLILSQKLAEEDARKIFKALASVASVGAIIAEGVAAEKPFFKLETTPPTSIVDDVCFELLGFRPSIYFDLIKNGKQQSAIDTAAISMKQAGATVDSALQRVDAILQVIDKIIAAVQNISNTFGGALDALVRVCNEGKAELMPALDETRRVVNTLSATAAPIVAAVVAKQRLTQEEKMALAMQAAGNKGTATMQVYTPPTTVKLSQPSTVNRTRTPIPPASRTVTVVNPPAVAPGTPPRVSPGTNTTGGPPVVVRVNTPPPPPPQPQPESNPAGLLAGAAAGFLVGGPAGAILGAGIGTLFKKG